MKNCLLFAALMLVSLSVLADESGVVGYWRTIDDVTGKPKAIIKISESQDHTLRGQILKIFPRPGFDQNEVCAQCEGDKHNQRIVGMTVMNQLKLDKDNEHLYTQGSILDPNNGKTYHCNVLLTQNGQQLEVRGYLGIPLFGRSQTWVRVNSA